MKRFLSLTIILSILVVGIGTTDAAQSIESLEKKLSSNPQDVTTLYKLTRLYCEHEMETKAIESWRKLVDLDPDKASELYLIAWVSVYLGIEPFYPQPISDQQAWQPRLSPDGKWIVFLALNRGMHNVARMDFFGNNFSWITAKNQYHKSASFVDTDEDVLYTVFEDQAGTQLIHRNLQTDETRVIFSNLAPNISYISQNESGGPIVFSYVSPDNKTNEIGLYDVKKGKFTPLTSSPYSESFPRFSSDGREIVLSINPLLDNDLYIMNRKGKILEQLTETDEYERNPDFGDNDKKVVFASNMFGPGQMDIGMYDRRTGEIIPITCNEADDDFPDLSNDGKWLVFQSSRIEGQTTIYFVSLDQHVPIDVLIEEIDKKK